MNAFIVTALMLVSPLNRHVTRIAKAIHRLQPHGNVLVEEQLSRSMYYWSKQYHVDPLVSVAIGFQESSLIPGKIGPTGDLGIFQVHGKTIKNYDISLMRLQADIDYQVQTHMLIMADKLSQCHDKTGWSCYHSFTPEHRTEYEQQVEQHLKRIRQ